MIHDRPLSIDPFAG